MTGRRGLLALRLELEDSVLQLMDVSTILSA